MKRASYREAIEWIARNDDCEWLKEGDQFVCVTLCLIADIFDVEIEKAIKDLRRVHKRVWRKP